MSATRDTHERFRRLPMFAGCSEAELAEIDRLADEVSIEPGRVVMRQGDLGQEFAVVVSGSLDVVKDDVAVASLGPGDYFGELALLETIPRTASVVATSDVVLEVIDRRGFNTLLDDLPSLSRSMVKGMAHRLVELEALVNELRGQLDAGS
ncbi:MAG: cyclic nucleotide-binding domain-containing protein [Actinobacteria bacterium]|nr:cyclic nucleotide-binding domain-containing protein [Actinomycetota bacterium]